MTKEERIAKIIHRVESALLHAKKLYDDTLDDEVAYVVGDLTKASERLNAINRTTHTGVKEKQMELF